MPTPPFIPTRTCNKCGTVRTVAEFSTKPNGTVRTTCKQCQREYNRLHYQAHRDTRIKEISARKTMVRAKLQAICDQAREAAECVHCGHQGGCVAQTPGGTPSWMVKAEKSETELRDALAQATWACRRCAGRVTGAQPSKDPAVPTVMSCVVAAVGAGASTFDDIFAAVSAARETTRASVRQNLAVACRSGAVARTARGRYSLPVDVADGT
jgi:hypothetical protein